jgi:potassium-transporting ATPase KdpC subunit
MFAPLRISIVLLVICGLVYPALVVIVGGLAFPYQASGSIITDANGNPVGSELIAQAFDKDGYFHPRPSAAGTDGYDATNSGGSNLGPTNQKLIDRVTSDAAALKAENPNLTVLPADLLTTSGSGLDPDISPDAAIAQTPRVAKARGLSEQQVRDLINSHITGRDLGIFGEPRVNVLKLNLALDQVKPLP